MKKDTGLLICELDTLTVTAECLLQTFLAIEDGLSLYVLKGGADK